MTKKENKKDAKAEEATAPEKKELTQEEEDYKTQMQRIQAEFDNFRRRTQVDQERFKEVFTSNILEKFIPILDHFELAVKHDCSDKNYAMGVEMILGQFKQVLSDSGVEEIQTKQFNPAEHDAIATKVAKEKAENDIVDVQMKGYKIGEKIIRKAKVIVNKLEEN